MSSSRAVGLDGMPIQAVRRCFDVIGPLLLHLINKSIVTGVFPERWKIACVVPILKAGDRSVASNYRPISLLPIMSKIAERVVCTQLSRYLSENHLMSACQYAYRRGHSTEDAVIDAVSWAVNKIDNGELASITTIDLSKAFDSVDHGVLLRKLSWLGVVVVVVPLVQQLPERSWAGGSGRFQDSLCKFWGPPGVNFRAHFVQCRRGRPPVPPA